MKRKIIWVTTANLNIANNVIPTGGQIYEVYLKKFLKRNFNLQFIHLDKSISGNIFKKIKQKFYYKKEASSIEIFGDILLMDSAIATFIPLKSSYKKITLIHHMGLHHNNIINKLLYDKYLDRRFYRRLPNIDVIVTVSKWWQKFFENKGHRNVRIIYNSFNMKDFIFSEEEVEKFKRDYNLQHKPIVYLGMFRKGKGAHEAYHQLQNIDAYFVTTGKKGIEIPTIHLDLSYRDYQRLLKASNAVVLMSEFEEGWNRIAHEAMLCKTPVIGSGRGGMQELLKGGGQIICKDSEELREHVGRLLSNPEEAQRLGERGYEFAKKFDLNYFEKEWVKLIEELTQK